MTSHACCTLLSAEVTSKRKVKRKVIYRNLLADERDERSIGGEDCVSINNPSQDIGRGYSDKKQHLVVSIKGKKLQTMYQLRE